MSHKGRTAVSLSRRGCRGLHLHNGAFPTAAPYPLRQRGTGSREPPRSTNSGPVRRGDSDRTTRQGTSASEGIQLGGQRSNGRRRHRGSKPLHRGRMGTGGICIAARVQATRCPRSFGPLLQSVPRPWEVMEYRNGIGATTPTTSSRSRQKGRSCRSCVTRHPMGDCRGRARDFSLWFPAPSVGFILHIPSPS